MKLVKGINARSEVLEYSLMIENLCSFFLSGLLGISDYKKSKSLGNTGSSLSFNQKVELLIDIQALDSKEKSKYMTFMSIRNQFMHNIDADSYEKCFNHLKGTDNFLLAAYPQDSTWTKEKQLENATRDLAHDVITITVNLMEKVKEKIGEKVKNEMLEEYQEASMSAITAIEKAINSVYENKVKKGVKTIGIEELKDLGSEVRSIFYKIILGKTLKKTSANVNEH